MKEWVNIPHYLVVMNLKGLFTTLYKTGNLFEAREMREKFQQIVSVPVTIHQVNTTAIEVK